MARSKAAAGAGGAQSQRQLRVGELVRHALAEILQRGDIADPEIERASITVPEVRMSPDLRHAAVFVMPLGGSGRDQVLVALARNRRALRAALAGRVRLKYMPDLSFDIDGRFDAAERVDELLRSPQVARDLDRDD